MLTDSELIELEKLLHQQEIDDRRSALIDPNHKDHTKNYKFIQKQNNEREYDSKGNLIKGTKITTLEGSARSGKTISIVDETIRIGLYETASTIFIVRETYAEFKTTLYKDYKERLDYFDLPNPFHDKEEVKSFKIGNARITFLGADKIGKKLGAGSDYLFFNEVLFGIKESVFKQLVTRCSIAVYCDYNPAFTKHWFYDKVLKRSDVAYLRTTYKDNQYCPPAQKQEIEASEPWDHGTYDIIDDELFYNYEPIDENNQPPINKRNHENGTIDQEYWMVYGLGLRGAMKGRIFKKVRYIDEFPDLPYIIGNDFGFTSDPNATLKYTQTKTDIYIEPLIYEPIESPELLDEAFQSVGISYDSVIIADSADRYVSGKHGVVKMVQDLYQLGYINISKVSKTKSVAYWLGKMKTKRINIVRTGNKHLDEAMQRNFENLIWKEINGIQLNIPDDKCEDHNCDASRYCYMSWEFANFSVDTN
jgi:PBSX family phage terminase large subunit